jgi:hypothetical protein
MTTPKLLPRALLYLLNFLQGFLYRLLNVYQQNSNAPSALKSRNSTSLLIGQSMYMKMFSRSPVHSLIVESLSHSNERPIGLDTRMNDTDSSKIGLAAKRTAIIHAFGKTILFSILSESTRSLSQELVLVGQGMAARRTLLPILTMLKDGKADSQGSTRLQRILLTTCGPW